MAAIDLCTITDLRGQLNLGAQGLGSLILTIGGVGYTSPPTVVFTPVDGNGTGAAATATVSAGAVTVLLITNKGTGYTTDPVVSFTGGGGTGAAAAAYIGDDLNLSKLITRISQRFLSAVEKPLFASSITEVRDGKNHFVMVMRVTPVISVTSVTVDTKVIPPSPDGLQAGWVNDDQTVKLVARAGGPTGYWPGGSAWARGWVFTSGFQNVTIVYRGGYETVPGDVTEAVIEWAAQRVVYRQHQGVRSKSLAGESITYDLSAMPDFVQGVVARYKNRGYIE